MTATATKTNHATEKATTEVRNTIIIPQLCAYFDVTSGKQAKRWIYIRNRQLDWTRSLSYGALITLCEVIIAFQGLVTKLHHLCHPGTRCYKSEQREVWTRMTAHIWIDAYFDRLSIISFDCIWKAIWILYNLKIYWTKWWWRNMIEQFSFSVMLNNCARLM